MTFRQTGSLKFTPYYYRKPAVSHPVPLHEVESSEIFSLDHLGLTHGSWITHVQQVHSTPIQLLSEGSIIPKAVCIILKTIIRFVSVNTILKLVNPLRYDMNNKLIALSPGHSLLFNNAHWKQEGLVCDIIVTTSCVGGARMTRLQGNDAHRWWSRTHSSN